MKSYSQALKILRNSKIKIKDEYIDSSKSFNRICAINIRSKVYNPSSNNSSVDGYAINSKETQNLNIKKTGLFEILGSVAGGDKPKKIKKKRFQTVEIMTGGLVPKNFDTIIPVEQIFFHKNKRYIIIDKKFKKNQNIRLKGSDFKKNDLVIKKGTIINSNHILAFKALGIKKIKVKKKPNILFFSTGNEISNKNKIPEWKVRNSNSHYLKSICESFFFNFYYGGILRDKDENKFNNQIKKMFSSKIDIIITSGAVSAGKFDFVPKVINKFKLSNFFKSVAIRPGKPILFARISGKQKSIFGLPGNPISSAACFRFFVYPYLQNILGLEKERPLKAILKNSHTKKKNFVRFTKSKIHTTKNGKIEIYVLGGQESFRIQSFVKSNIWAVLPSGKSKFKKNDIVDCFFPNHPNNFFI